MKLARWIWVGLVVLLYLFFWSWHGGEDRPLTEEEGAELIQQMEEAYGRKLEEAPEGSMISNLHKMISNDDGKEFYAVNLEQLRLGPAAEDADRRYAEMVLPEILKRGGYPIFLGNRAGLMLGVYGKDVDRVAVIRYRSLRDLFDMILAPEMQSGSPLKFASLDHTEVFIVRPVVSFVQVRLLVGLILLIVALGGFRLISRLQKRERNVAKP